MNLFFKCENFQRVGAFKARGAFHAVLRLSDEERARGVVTTSSGMTIYLIYLVILYIASSLLICVLFSWKEEGEG
jgi:hypothetical protein